MCAGTRAFTSGRYVHQTGHWDNASPYIGTPRGWGHQLQDAGIPVESIGKLHYRDPADPSGFDRLHIPMMVQDGVGMVWASIRHEDERLHAPGRMLGPEIGHGESSYTRYDAAVTARTVDWLREAAGRPQGWCLYVGLVAPHFPLYAEALLRPLDGMDLPAPKLHPDTGYQRHPWVEKQNAMMDTETRFVDEEGAPRLCCLLRSCELDGSQCRSDHRAEEAGLSDDTTVIAAATMATMSGRAGCGENPTCMRSVAVPMLMADPALSPGVCETPVSLLDLAAGIGAFRSDPDPEMVGAPLAKIAAGEEAADRVFVNTMRLAR